MADHLDILDQAIGSAKSLRRALGRNQAQQVSSKDERGLVKATALAWIRNQRQGFGHGNVPQRLQTVDEQFTELLELSERSITRERYKQRLKQLVKELVDLRTDVIANPNFYSATRSAVSTPPEWAKLVSDTEMQAILTRRWNETSACIDADAHLAATVMMGAMLEALLLSRANRVSDKSKLFKAKCCPKDKKGKSLVLSKWTLKNYIEVAYELGWIRQSAKDVSVVLRDYRNYIHPAKELSHGVRIERDDSEMFWLVFKSLAEQISKSV